MVCENLAEKSHLLLAVGVISMLMMQSAQAESDISRLQDVVNPAKNGALLAQESGVMVIQVTGVQANPTETGVEVILQTPQGEQLQITNRSAENNFIADIPNAQLLLPSGDGFTFTSQNPVEGITEITVINLDDNTIRVTVTGVASIPVVELFDSPEEGLIFAIAGAVAATPSPQPQAEAEAESEIPPAQPSTQGDQQIELVVTGQQDVYRVREGSTATRTDTPLRDVPASISVIPRQLLEDQNTTRIQDALQNVSSVQKRDNTGIDSGTFVIRGFEQFGGIFRNGFAPGDTSSAINTANIERIEVLRGPASVLYGQIAPGGIINIVTRQPLSTPYYSVDFSAGSFGFYQPSVDLSGPLTDDGSLLYRLNLAYENSQSFRDNIFAERIFVAPVLTWNISDRTSLTVDFEYQDDDYRLDRGIPAIGDRPAPIPIDRFIGYRFDGDIYNERTLRASYRLQHQFSEDWELRNAFSFQSTRLTGGLSNGPFAIVDNQFADEIYLGSNDILGEAYTLQTELVGQFNTGSIVHQPLLGVELRRNTFFLRGSEVLAPPLDIFNPNYDVPLPDFSVPDFFFEGSTRTNTLGIYLQNQVTLADDLNLLIGGRFDTIRQETDFGTLVEQSDSAFSPRVGIVYQPIEPVSLYASYSQSFVPVSGRNATDEPFEPTRGTQYEVGIKTDITEQLSATLAVYQIARTNLLTTDLDNPRFSTQVGEQRSRGIELDIAGEILPGWNVITSYTYTDAVISNDNRLPVGNRLQNVPKHAASLWTTYELQQGDLQGLGFGLGLYYVGEKNVDLANTATIPSYFRTDSAIYYKRDNWRLALNIRNLFNTTYYEAAQSRQFIYPGAPFTVIGSFSIQF
ncbi:MAG: TonB-dependent siderophore receptor [Nostoc sp. LLA-1]|nr:TonB-dependent siderophore receptor [Cyanocohniella sp. LLY]